MIPPLITPLLLAPVAVDAALIESLRLVRDARGVRLMYATTEKQAQPTAPYRTVLTEVELDGASSARIFEVQQILPARCSWDLEPDSNGKRSLLLDPHGGGTRKLLRVMQEAGVSALTQEPERALPSLRYPYESFSAPRVARGPGAGGLMTAVVDESRLVAFPPASALYVSLCAGLGGVLVRAGGHLRLFYQEPRIGAWRADNLPPGTLRALAFDNELRPQGNPATVLDEQPSYGLDADADDHRLAVAALAKDGLTVRVSLAADPPVPVVDFMANTERGLLSSPSVLLADGALHVAAIEAAESKTARVLYAKIASGGLGP